MYEVKLPDLKWFGYGNVFTGSLGTDRNRGCFSMTTMQYRVLLKTSKTGNALFAGCSFVLPWGTTTNIREATIAEFEATDFGVEIAENWIRSNFIIDDPQAPYLLT